MTRSLTAMSLLVLAGCLHEKDPSAYVVRDDQPRVSDAPPAAGGSDGALDGASEGSDSDVEDPIVPTTRVPSCRCGNLSTHGWIGGALGNSIPCPPCWLHRYLQNR